MKNFWLASLLVCAMLAGCRSYTHRFTPIKPAIESFTPTFLDTAQFEHTFRARIEAYGNSMTGVLVLKKIADNQYRVALLSELGGTLLAFELADGKLNLHQAIEPLRRRPVIALLEQDFPLLFQDNALIKKQYIHGDQYVYETSIGDERAYHYLRKSDGELMRTIRAVGAREHTSITYDYRSRAFPDITLSRRGGKLNIFLFLLLDDTDAEAR